MPLTRPGAFEDVEGLRMSSAAGLTQTTSPTRLAGT